MTRLLIILSFFLTSACTSIKSGAVADSTTKQTWVNLPKKELVAQLGPPNRTNSDENGGEIYTYEKRDMRNIIVHKDGKSVFESHLFLAETFYYIDKEGKIYNVKTQAQPIK